MRSLISILIVTLMCTSASASKEAGNGGGVLVCKNPLENETLDLWEAKIRGLVTETGLSIIHSNESVDDQIKDALNRLKKIWPMEASLIDKIYQNSLEIKRATVQGQKISAPHDAYNEFEKEDCELRGAVLYKDDLNSFKKDILWVDEKLMSTLSNTHQAALWVHEIVYKLLRYNLKVSDSKLARKVVGYLFADKTSYPKDSISFSTLSLIHRKANISINPFVINEFHKPLLKMKLVDLSQEKKCGVSTVVEITVRGYQTGVISNDTSTSHTTISGPEVTFDLTKLLSTSTAWYSIGLAFPSSFFPEGCVYTTELHDPNGNVIPNFVILSSRGRFGLFLNQEL